MSELDLDLLPQAERISPDSELYSLHGDELRLPDEPLMRHAEVLQKYNYNAALLGVINLPSEHGPDLQIGVLDFGDHDYSDAGSRPDVFIYNGKSVPLFGKATSRFGLTGLNYTPEEHLAAYAALPDEGKMTIGRDPNEHTNYKLGLTNSSLGSDYQMISRKHLTVKVEDEGVTLKDSSTNGTVVETASEPKKLPSGQSKELGRLVV